MQREIIEYLSKWRKVIPIYVSEDSILLRCQFSPNGSIVLYRNTNKNSNRLLKLRDWLKFMWKCKRATIIKIASWNALCQEKDKPGWAGTRSGEFHVWAFQQLHMFLKSAFIILSYSQFRNLPLFHQWCSGPYQQCELINQLRGTCSY